MDIDENTYPQKQTNQVKETERNNAAEDNDYEDDLDEGIEQVNKPSTKKYQISVPGGI